MKSNPLHQEFEEAVAYIASCTINLTADTKLKLYAYYKIATRNRNSPDSRTPLINAFKANALFQARDTDRETAMNKYIALAHQIKSGERI